MPVSQREVRLAAQRAQKKALVALRQQLVPEAGSRAKRPPPGVEQMYRC